MSVEIDLITKLWNTIPKDAIYQFKKETETENPMDLLQSKKNKAIWKLSLLSRLFNEELLAFRGEIPKKIREIGSKMKSIYPNLIIQTLVTTIPIIVAVNFKGTKPSLQRRPLFRQETFDVAFFFPKHRLCLANSPISKSDSWVIKDFFELEPIKIRSLENTKLYNSEKIIKRLRVATIQEIAGFTGLDYIEFVGESVKEGLKGLQIRQEIKVNLENMGPKLAVGTNNLEVKVGGYVHLKTLSGIAELASLVS